MCCAAGAELAVETKTPELLPLSVGTSRSSTVTNFSSTGPMVEKARASSASGDPLPSTCHAREEWKKKKKEKKRK